MPKINRVRIVNFSYNGNKRHIIDELFDFYGGENALLSLANGGGKSVLVQAMLQPILPKLTLLKRKFSDFFVSRTTPSYIMLEWKLDDEAGYLLTGIALTNRTSHSAGEEDESFDIRYFTFINSYSKGNAFDIKNIPVTEESGSSVNIAKYHELRKLLQKEAGKNGSGLSVFDSSREDQSRYDSTLGSYNISKDEWKELIVSINEAEHGVSQVFSECKTSRRVMEQWIIRYIEKVLNKSSDSGTSDHKKLEIMMGQVAQSLVDNEKYIREYRAIEEFNRELGGLYGAARTVLAQLDKEDQLKKDIFSGYIALKAEDDRLSQELGDVGKRLLELEEELGNIAHEERSFEIYEYSDKLGEIEARLAETTAIIDDHNRRLTDTRYRRNLQRAAEKYGRIQGKKKSIAELQQRLENASKDQKELLKKLNSIKFMLKMAYGSQIMCLGRDIAGMKSELEAVWDEIRNDELEIKAGQQQIIKLNGELGGLDREIANFKVREKDVLDDLGIQLVRNPLLEELDINDITNAENALSDELQKAEQLLDESNSMAEKLKAAITELKREAESLGRRNTELKVDESNIATRIEYFNREKEIMLEVLRKFDIKEELLYDKPLISKAVKQYLNDWENKAYSLKMEISELEKQIHGIESGVSYLPANLVSLLQKHNLSFYTGEKYLREINDEERERLLADNPLLPYAILVTDKEKDIIESLVKGIELSQIIPVIRHNFREKEMGSVTEGLEFITSSRNITLDSRNLSDFINMLVFEKNQRLNELENANEVIERVNHDYQTILDFGWTEKQALELELERANNRLQIEANNEALHSRLNAVNEAEEQLQMNTKRIEDIRKDILTAGNRIGRFKEYLADNTRYMENIQSRNSIQSQINTLAADERKCQNQLEMLREKEKELQSHLTEKMRRQKDVEGKLSEVADAAEPVAVSSAGGAEPGFSGAEPVAVTAAGGAEPGAADIPELEGQLQACRREQKNDAAELEEQIKDLKKDIRNEEKDIGKLKLESEEYKNITYSERIEAELEAQCEKLENNIKGLNEEKTEQQLEMKGLSERIEFAAKALKGRPTVPRGEIRGDFSHRSEAVKDQVRKMQDYEKKIRDEQFNLVKLITRVEIEIKGLEYYRIETELKAYSEVKESIGLLLDEYVKLRRETNDSIRVFSTVSMKFTGNYSNSEEGTVKEAVKGLQCQLDALDRTYDKYYYLTERMDYYFEQLSNILKIMESKIQQLEHSRKDLTEHAFVEACRIYHEIPKISENSSVEIDGIRRKVLDIDYEKMTDEAEARGSMNSYIEECLQSLTKLIKGNEDENKLRREIEKYMSTKELLNIVSSLENCRIKAYKVDLNEKNRGMMVWEDIIVKNSGGEKFIAYFSLLVALISYSRKQIKGYDEFRRREESKVLIMDNPFGPITSGHLLKPMFDIAQKYNTQLICLSDIKQGTVLNSFDLIYMIKIRQNMMQEDFIELEPIVQREMKQDERLENVNLYSKVEQVSLFEM